MYSENAIIFFNFNNFLFKPSIMGLVFYLMYRAKSKTHISFLEFIFSLTLIYQLGLLTEILSNIYLYQFDLFNYSDYIMNMADNNQNNNNNNNFNNIPQNNNDLSRLVRYIAGNAGALMAGNPRSRAASLFVTNSLNLIADVVSNEEKANYWIDQWNHYQNTGRFRGGQSGSVPFERGTDPDFNPFNPPKKNDNDNDNGGSGINTLIDSSDSSDNFIRNLLSPVDHSIPLETLINQHFIIILGLFFIVLALILIVIFYYVDLIIIFNKDYLLNKVNNKFVLMYVKYVVFSTRVNLIFISTLILVILLFLVYCLHYLITHPIILNK